MQNKETLTMHTIALVTQKGGSGKSTLAIGLAIAAIQDGHTVRILETDPLGTLSNWRHRRTQAEPAVEAAVNGDDIEEKLQAFERSGVTLAIIDTAGGDRVTMQAAISAADLCLIPARPSPADIEAAGPTLRIIRDNDKPFAFVLNQTPPRGLRIAEAATSLGDAATELNVMGVLALPYIALRNDQQDALGAGLSVSEYARNGKSADEIGSLWQWVWRKMSPEAIAYEQPAAAYEPAELRVAS
jgi:chromosome partitioning protein